MNQKREIRRTTNQIIDQLLEEIRDHIGDLLTQTTQGQEALKDLGKMLKHGTSLYTRNQWVQRNRSFFQQNIEAQNFLVLLNGWDCSPYTKDFSKTLTNLFQEEQNQTLLDMLEKGEDINLISYDDMTSDFHTLEAESSLWNQFTNTEKKMFFTIVFLIVLVLFLIIYK